jgi:hypothetical protein
MIAGTTKHLAGGASFSFASRTFAPADVQALLQAFIDLRAAVEAARAALQTKLVEEAAQAPALRDLIAGYAAFVKVSFSQSPDVLADFGLAPKKERAPLTIEQRALANERRNATRAARHTMGSRQKKAVKGTVTTIIAPPPPASKP